MIKIEITDHYTIKQGTIDVYTMKHSYRCPDGQLDGLACELIHKDFTVIKTIKHNQAYLLYCEKTDDVDSD